MPEQKTIFIAEDDHFLSSLLKARLERDGFAVMQAYDGEETLTLIRRKKPDLLILDLIMPKMSGFEVMQAMSIDPAISGVPVIVLSNLAQESDVEKVRKLGAQDYFVKVKISIDQVVNRIRAAMGLPAGTPAQTPITSTEAPMPPPQIPT